jgi:hypothetical protein
LWKGFLDRICGPFGHRHRKTLSGAFRLDNFPSHTFMKLTLSLGAPFENQPAVNAAKDVVSHTFAALNIGEEKPTELGIG